MEAFERREVAVSSWYTRSRAEVAEPVLPEIDERVSVEQRRRRRRDEHLPAVP